MVKLLQPLCEICFLKPGLQARLSSNSVCVLSFLPKSHLGNVLVDMKLIDVKDTLPVGFIPIQETVDTRESALNKHACLGRSRLHPVGLQIVCVFLSASL